MADSILDEQSIQALREVARQRGQSIQQIARLAIERFLREAGAEPVLPAPGQPDPLLALSGIGRSGQTDISEHTNEILKEEIDPQRGWTFHRDSSD
jgi:hypothetical protein